MKFVKCIVCLICLLSTGIANAENLKSATETQKQEIKSNISKISSTTSSLQCNFTQKKRYPFWQEKFVSTRESCTSKNKTVCVGNMTLPINIFYFKWWKSFNQKRKQNG